MANASRGRPQPRRWSRCRAAAAADAGASPASPQGADLRAPARAKRSVVASGSAPIIQAGSVTGNSLTLVVGIMCFLACLTAGAVYMVNQSASAWLRDIASEVTVQVPPRDGVDVDQEVTKVALFLAKLARHRRSQAAVARAVDGAAGAVARQQRAVEAAADSAADRHSRSTARRRPTSTQCGGS